MIPRCAFVLCWLLVPSVAQAQEWSGFEWIRAGVGGKISEKAAIYLRVKISGLAGEYYMQLDTGAPRTMLYGVPYKQILQEHNALSPEVAEGKSSNRFSTVSFSGSIGRLGLTDVPVLLYRDYGTPISRKNKYPKIGTIGLDIFREHPLILDFPRRRFAVLGKGDSIPLALEQRATFFEVTVRDGLMFIPVFYDEQQIDNIFYDTGSSIFPLVTTRSIWQKLTGRTGDESDNEHLTIFSWGKEVVMTGARMKKSLRVGSRSVGRSMVYFAPPEAENLSFEKSPFKVSGLVGNALFYDDDLVIIDLPRKRMAILPSK
jgi:hypothetical protein